MCKYDYDPYFPDPIDPNYMTDCKPYVVSVKRWKGKPVERCKFPSWDLAVKYADSVSETSYVVLIVGDNGDVLKKYINYLHQ